MASIKFTETFALATGPNGNRYVEDLTQAGRCISIRAFLFSKWNPWSAAEKAALRALCQIEGIDVRKAA